MYSLLYNSDIKEYYICNSKNVIQEDEGGCIVAFKAQLVLTNSSKFELFKVQNNLLKNRTDEVIINTHVSKIISACDEAKSQLQKKKNELNSAEHYKDVQPEKKSITIDNSWKNKYCGFCSQIYKKINLHFTKAHALDEQKNQCKSRINKDTRHRHFMVFKNKIYRVCQTGNNNKLKVGTRGLQEKRCNAYPGASTCLKNALFSKFGHDRLNKILLSDELIDAYANTLCKQCKNVKTNKYLRTRLRTLGRILLEMKQQDSSVTDLTSLFNPKYVSSLNKLEKSVFTGFGFKLLYECGKLLINLKKNRVKTDAEEFLRLLLRSKKRKISEKLFTKVHRPIEENKCRHLHKPLITKEELNFLEDNKSCVLLNKISIHTPIKAERKLLSDCTLNLPSQTEELQVSADEEGNRNIESDIDEEIHSKIHTSIMIKQDVSTKIHTPVVIKQEEICNKLHIPIMVKPDEVIAKENTENKLTNRDLSNILAPHNKQDQEMNCLDNSQKIDEILSVATKSTQKFCCFCKKFYTSSYIGEHFERRHRNEEKVKHFISLPRGSFKRKLILNSMTEDEGHTCQSNKVNKKDNSKTLQQQSKFNDCASNISNGNVILEEANSVDVIKWVIQNNSSDIYIATNSNRNQEEVFDNNNILDNCSKETIVDLVGLSDGKNFLEDDLRVSLWEMLETHVNCLTT